VNHSILGNRLIYWYFVILSAVVVSSCAHIAPYKEAVRLEETGQYYHSAKSALNSLNEKPDYDEAKTLLSRIAESAFSQREKDAQNFVDNNNYPPAIEIYRELQDFSSRCNLYGVGIPAASGLSQQIEEVSNAGAKKWYMSAEKKLQINDYEDAINSYKKSLELSSGYKDAREKIAQCHRSIAEQLLARKKWRDAAKRFEDAASYSQDDFLDKRSSANCYYTLGMKFYEKKKYRNAYSDLETCCSLDPDNRDAEELRDACLAKGTVRLAIFPIHNRTGTQPAGISVEDYLYDSIVAGVQNKCSPFLELIDRQNLDLILNEYGLAESGNFMDPNTVVKKGKIRGFDYILSGKITRLTSKESGLITKNKRNSCQVPVYVETRGKYGTVLKRVGERNATLRYEEIKEDNSIIISGSLQITDSSTGRSVLTKPFSAERKDSVNYAINGEWSYPKAAYIDDTDDLWKHMENDSLRNKFSANQNCTSLSDLTTEAIEKLKIQFVNQIIDKLDSIPDIPDPI